ncbi:MAG: TRAP transporter substrate-binding protein DctP [Actinomycetales bacterium]
MTPRRSRARLAAISTIVAGGLAFVGGCADETARDQASNNASSGDGLAAGATMEEYQAAFESIDPITLTTQSPSPKGAATGKNVEDYFAAITEWSGGKITFEISYANALVPVTEVDNALNDGRLDVGQVLPIYEPAEFPANAAMVELTVLSDQRPVLGDLQGNAWPNQVAFQTPEMVSEFEDKGMKVLVPFYNSGANVLWCRDERVSLDQLKGMQAAAGGTAQSAEITSIGGTPVSVAYPELFESLQRGVVDCSVSSMTVGVLGGFISAAPHGVVDPDAGFALAPGAMAVSSATWDELPLVARQLMWDRIDVFLGENVTEKIWPNNAEAVATAKANGGGITAFQPDARTALQSANEQILTGVESGSAVADPAGLVESSRDAAEEWTTKIEGLELSGIDGVDYTNYDTWDHASVDISPFTDAVMESIWAEGRPQ